MGVVVKVEAEFEAPVETPVVAEPVVEEPVVEEPVVEEPVVAEPVVEEPVVAEAPVEEAPSTTPHVDCLKNAKWAPAQLLEYGKKLFNCLSGKLSAKWW